MLPYWSRRNSTMRILFSRLPTMSAVCIVVRRPCFSLQFFQQKQKDCNLYISSSIFFSVSPFINPWTYASPTSSELFPRGRMISGVLHPNRIEKWFDCNKTNLILGIVKWPVRRCAHRLCHMGHVHALRALQILLCWSRAVKADISGLLFGGETSNE
jgi:hypothetical protein